MKAKIYIEGGGTTNALRTRCREGFRGFFGKLDTKTLDKHLPSFQRCQRIFREKL